MLQDNNIKEISEVELYCKMLKTETVNGSWTLFECVGQLFGHGPEELVEAIRKGLQTQWLMLKKLRRSETISELSKLFNFLRDF